MPENNTIKSTFRHNSTIEGLLQCYMKTHKCDKSTALRRILQQIIDMGIADVIC